MKTGQCQCDLVKEIQCFFCNLCGKPPYLLDLSEISRNMNEQDLLNPRSMSFQSQGNLEHASSPLAAALLVFPVLLNQ